MSGCCLRGLCRPHEKQGFPTNTSPSRPVRVARRVDIKYLRPAKFGVANWRAATIRGWRTAGAPTSAPGPTNSMRFNIPRSSWPLKLSEIGILEKPMKSRRFWKVLRRPLKRQAENAASVPALTKTGPAGREAYPDHFRLRLPGGFTYRPLSRLSARGLGRSLERPCKWSPCKRSAALGSRFGFRE